MNQRPAAPLGKQVRGSGTAVVAAVSTDGKFATVLVNDKIPGEPGYAIPLGVGPWVQGTLGGPTALNGSIGSGATTLTFNSGGGTGYQPGDYVYLGYGLTTQEIVVIKTIVTDTITCAATTHAHTTGEDIEPSTKGFGYYFNNPAGDGGNIVTVDLDLKRITNVSSDVSKVLPTPFYSAVSDHSHTGLFNPATGIVDPEPINVGSLATNPNPSTAPVLVGTVTGPTYPIVGPTYAGQVTFSLTIGNPTWLLHLRTFAIPHGSGTALAAQSPWNDYSPKGSGTYSVIFDGLSAGTSYDFYVAYVDVALKITPLLFLATTIANPLSITTGLLATMPGGVTPVFETSGSFTYSSASPTSTGNTGSYDTTVSIQLDGLSTTSNPWLGEIRLVAQATGSTGIVEVGKLAPVAANGSGWGAYTATWGPLGMGNSYAIGVQYVDHAGNFSAITNLGTAAFNGPLKQGVPSGITFSLSTASYSLTMNFRTSTGASGGTPLNSKPYCSIVGNVPWSVTGTTDATWIKDIQIRGAFIDPGGASTTFQTLIHSPIPGNSLSGTVTFNIPQAPVDSWTFGGGRPFVGHGFEAILIAFDGSSVTTAFPNGCSDGVSGTGTTGVTVTNLYGV